MKAVLAPAGLLLWGLALLLLLAIPESTTAAALTPWATFVADKTNKATCPGKSDQPCTIPEGKAVVISAQDITVRSLTVFGTLVIRPDLNKNKNLKLNTAFLIASGPSASINVTAKDDSSSVAIYLKRDPTAYDDVPMIPQRHMFTGGRVFGGANGARIYVEGAPVKPHFTLLGRHVYDNCGLQTCARNNMPGSIFVVDDVRNQWKQNWDIVIAPSDQQYNVWISRLAIRPGAFQAKIVKISAADNGLFRIDLDRPIPGFNFSATNPPNDTPYIGPNLYPRDKYPVYYGDPVLGHQAEVFVLNRNVRITGDDFSSRFAPIPPPDWQNPKNSSTIDNGWPTPWSKFANSAAPVEGLHTIIAGMTCTLKDPCESGGGWMIMRYAFIEKAGQRGWVGRYPVHLHRMGNCPLCEVTGNVVSNTQQRGITIHSTGNAKVDSNIVFAFKGAGIYVEEGTEIGNTISNNIVVCDSGVVSYSVWNPQTNNWALAGTVTFPQLPTEGGSCQLTSAEDYGDPSIVLGGCRVQGTDNEQADCIQQSGLWALSTTNNIIANRVVNNYNCIYFQSTRFMDGRRGTDSFGRVCPIHSNWGKIKDNVCVAHQRFGFYPDVNYPREVDRSISTHGYVEDLLTTPDCMNDLTNDATWCSCRAYKLDGSDNGQDITIVESQLEIGSGFVGQYDLADVQYKDLRVLQSNIGMYWKGSKNFKYDGSKGLQAHVKDSTFFYDTIKTTPYAPWATGTSTYFLNVPGISGTFLVENVVFKGDAAPAKWILDGDPIGAAGAVLGVNQQCKGYKAGVAEGQICTPQVLLRNVSFEQVKDFGINDNSNPLPPQDDRPTWIKFGAESGNPFTGSVIAFDDSLCGARKSPCPFKSVVPKYSTHLLNLPGNPCNATLAPYEEGGKKVLPSDEDGDWSRRFYNGIICSVQTRRLTVWGKAQGTSHNAVSLVLIPPGKTVEQGFTMNWTAFNRAYDENQGNCPWKDPDCKMGTDAPVGEPRRFAEGYGAVVIPQEYLPGEWTIVRADGKPVDTSRITMVELSDVMFNGQDLPGPDTLLVSLNGKQCTLRSTDPRYFMTEYGPAKRLQSGGSCVGEWLRLPTSTGPPSQEGTNYPTWFPTRYPTRFPSQSPTRYPTRYPSRSPTRYPTRYPTRFPTRYPTKKKKSG